MTPQVGDIVRVRWVDSASVDEWRQGDELAAIATHECTSIGILAHVDDDRLMVAGSWDDVDGGYACTMIVPRKAVLSVSVIEEAKREEGG